MGGAADHTHEECTHLSALLFSYRSQAFEDDGAAKEKTLEVVGNMQGELRALRAARDATAAAAVAAARLRC
jgi:hypothetical protein